MEQEIQHLVENNEILKKYLQYPKEELKIIRIYINLELINIQKDSEKAPKVRLIKTCLDEQYNYLEYISLYRYKIDTSFVSTEEDLSRVQNLEVCAHCKCKICIKKSMVIFLEEINKINQKDNLHINYLEVIDYILNRKSPIFRDTPSADFFSSVNLADLFYVQAILESDLITLKKFDMNTNIAEFTYLNVTKKMNNEYYINILLNYYTDGTNSSTLTININDLKSIFTEVDDFLRVYKIAAYYKYLIEINKFDMILSLRNLLDINRLHKGIKTRALYFIHVTFKKVEALPYSNKTKEKIYGILNYILNYRYKPHTPYIPINIMIYSNDQEEVEEICKIIGEFMWFFGYLSETMKYYDEYINNIVLDKFSIKKLYYDKDRRKNGLLLIHNFENLLYTDFKEENIALNILTDEMDNNNTKVCTVIYGEKKIIKKIMDNHGKLTQILINLELEVDDLDIDKIYEIIINKLEKSENVSEKVKEKIYNYISITYKQSDTQNMEYVNKLYNQIILNMNNKFFVEKNKELNESHIPEAYNTRDLTTIMKDLNSLVGLTEIKEKINDLVALLNFNKKVNMNINDFNMHMIFCGNPGTGKTTVARLITDIFYNLGYIPKNKLTEVVSKDLIGEYVGQTSGKTYNVVKSALGGVLFIDEAYAIINNAGIGADYGAECIATLIKMMEDYKDKLIIIFAGYTDEMEKFQEYNPGLQSRIGYKINFPDYTLEELTQIFIKLLTENKLKINKKALEKLKNCINQSINTKNFGNGRYIHNIFQKILIEHAKNCEKTENSDLYLITENDIVLENLIADNKMTKIGFEED